MGTLTPTLDYTALGHLVPVSFLREELPNFSATKQTGGTQGMVNAGGGGMVSWAKVTVTQIGASKRNGFDRV